MSGLSAVAMLGERSTESRQASALAVSPATAFSAITVGGQWGQLDLNTMLPLIARNLLESVHLLASVSRVLAEKAVAGLVANAETCREQVERSPSLATALNPLIGYDQAAEIAKRAARERRSVRELAREMTKLPRAEIDQALDPRRQTEPGLGPGGGG